MVEPQPWVRVLERVVPVLSGAGVPYAIIGGVAVNLLGEARMTKDADLAIQVAVEKETDLVERFRRAGFDVERHGGPGAPLARWMRLRSPGMHPPVPVDLIFATDALWQHAVSAARLAHVEEMEVRVAPPEDVMLLKLRAGGLQDLFDVASIAKVQRMSGHPVDVAYLDLEAGHYGVAERWGKMRAAVLE